MKINILKTFIIPVALLSLAGCDKWMTPEPEKIDPFSPTETAKTPEFYEDLRQWKKSDHAISFGWYSEWGEGSVATGNMLSAVPDSMDIISLWNNSGEESLTPKKREDLRFVREVKGTKVVVCSFVWKIGDIYNPCGPDATLSDIKNYYGWVDRDVENNKLAMNKWIKDVADFLDRNGYDGIDIDYEPGENPGSGNTEPILSNREYITHFVKEMGKYIGPMSGTDKLFILDGYINTFPSECGLYFNYFVSQAYSVSAGAGSEHSSMNARNLQQRLGNLIANFRGVYEKEYGDKAEEIITNKFVVTDNMESVSVCLSGGYIWFDKYDRKWSPEVMPTLMGFADWKPESGFRKGGFGGYRFSNERAGNPPYKWLRKAIQQQNPAPGKDIITEDEFVAAK